MGTRESGADAGHVDRQSMAESIYCDTERNVLPAPLQPCMEERESSHNVLFIMFREHHSGEPSTTLSSHSVTMVVVFFLLLFVLSFVSSEALAECRGSARS